MSGLTSRIGRGASSHTRLSTAIVLPAANAARPVQSVYSTLPRLNRSLRASSASPRACSGDMYKGVPAITPDCDRLASSAARASPKSVILTRSTPFSKRMLAGLTSRWIRPCRWADARPSAACMPMRNTSLTASGPRALTRFASVTPAMNSITR
jgi:hypothetical protein